MKKSKECPDSTGAADNTPKERTIICWNVAGARAWVKVTSSLQYIQAFSIQARSKHRIVKAEELKITILGANCNHIIQ